MVLKIQNGSENPEWFWKIQNGSGKSRGQLWARAQGPGSREAEGRLLDHSNQVRGEKTCKSWVLKVFLEEYVSENSLGYGFWTFWTPFGPFGTLGPYLIFVSWTLWGLLGPLALKYLSSRSHLCLVGPILV